VGLIALAVAYVVGFVVPGIQNIFALTAVFAVAVWLGGDSVVRRFWPLLVSALTLGVVISVVIVILMNHS
jgi:hypothetical protein